MIIEQEELRALFRRRGLALTHQRAAVYCALASRKDHPTAEALYRRLKPRLPSLSLATVYQNLKTLRKAGLARAVDTPGSETRYDAETRVHHHTLCGRCGRIDDLFDLRLDGLSLPPRAGGFVANDYSVQFHGLCAACAARGSRIKARGIKA